MVSILSDIGYRRCHKLSYTLILFFCIVLTAFCAFVHCCLNFDALLAYSSYAPILSLLSISCSLTPCLHNAPNSTLQSTSLFYLLRKSISTPYIRILLEHRCIYLIHDERLVTRTPSFVREKEDDDWRATPSLRETILCLSSLPSYRKEGYRCSNLFIHALQVNAWRIALLHVSL